jgi:hypothetical protein
MWIEDTTADLSAVVYGQNYYSFPDAFAHGGRYWLYDDHAKTSTLLPVRQDERGWLTGVSIGPDGRWVVFASPDPTLQVGPVSRNCWRSDGFFLPMTAIYCAELYRYDLDTGELTQLTGLGGSSQEHHVEPEVSADGLTVRYLYGPLIPESGVDAQRLDLASGVVEEIADEFTLTWDRGTHDVVWDGRSGILRSIDHATGQSTNLFGAASDVYWARAWSSDDGRFLVLTSGGPDVPDIFRLVDTDTGAVRAVVSPWLSDDATSFALVQRNVAPIGDDRLVLAPLPPA